MSYNDHVDDGYGGANGHYLSGRRLDTVRYPL